MKKLLLFTLAILVCCALAECADDKSTATITVNRIDMVQNAAAGEGEGEDQGIVAAVEDANDGTASGEAKEEASEKSDEADATALSYSVSFLNIDGSVLQESEYKYGSTPIYDGDTPTYSDESNNYTFTDWDKSITEVTGTQIYTATYNKTEKSTDTRSIPTVTAPTANTLKYNGENQELITAASTTGGTLLYRLDDGEYTTSVPTAKNAGNYTVYYKVAGDESYKDVSEQSISVTIDKSVVKEPTVSGTYTYTGSEQTVTLSGVEDYMTVSSSLKQTDAGSYDIVYTLDDNHEWGAGSDGTVTWTIDKKDTIINTANVVKTYTYTGNMQTVNSGATVNSEGKITYTDNTFTDVPQGGKKTITITADATENYNAASVTVEITVNKATPSITNLALSDWTYGADANTPTADTNFGAVSYTYSDSENGEYSSTVPTDAGTYYVKASVEGTGNYNCSEVKKAFTVSKAKVDVPKAEDLALNGYTQTVVTSPTGAKYTLSAGATTNNGSYTATVTLSDKANYEWNLDTPTAEDQSIGWSVPQKQSNGSSVTSAVASDELNTGSEVSTEPAVKDGDIGHGDSYSDSTAEKTATVAAEGKGNRTITKGASFNITASKQNKSSSNIIKVTDCVACCSNSEATAPFTAPNFITARGDIICITNGVGGDAALSTYHNNKVFYGSSPPEEAHSPPGETLAEYCCKQMSYG